MKAFLLAAGLGTRLMPVTKTVPKCLVQIHNKPLMQYWFDLLDSPLISDIFVNTHYMPDKVRCFINRSNIRNKITIIHEEELLGTGGTVLKNSHFLGSESFLVAHADNLTIFNLEEFIKAHSCRPKGVEITMMTYNTDSPQSCGIVEVDEKDLVVGFYEKIKKPPSNLANAAVYIFEPSVVMFLKNLRMDKIDISNQVLPFFLNKIQIFHNSQYHRDIGSLESLMKAQEDFPK